MATSDRHQKESSIKESIPSDFMGNFSDLEKMHVRSLIYSNTNPKKREPQILRRLLDLISTPATQNLDDTDTPVDEGSSDSLTIPCEKHSQKYIEFYCYDHQTTLCQVCLPLIHRSCQIDYIPDVPKSTIIRNTLPKIIDRAESVENKCISMMHGLSLDTQRTMDSLIRSLTDLKKERSDVNRKLDTQEQEITKKITDFTKEKSNNVGTQCDTIKTGAKLLKLILNKMNKSKQSNQLFIELHQTTTLLDDYEYSLQSIEPQHQLDEYQFIPETSKQNIIDEENAIGTQSLKQKITPPTPSNIPSQRHERSDIKPKDPQVPLSSSNDHQPRQRQSDIKPTGVDEILVQTRENSYDCWITGMTENISGTLVMTDNRNVCIKLVDVKRKSVTSILRLEDRPWDITTISTTGVAVTVPDGQYILFVTVSNDMKESHRINTNGQCYGICHHQGKLIVTYCFAGKLDILDMQGKVIRSISTDTTGEDIFSAPFYVQANNQNIIVSDFINKNITMIDYSCNVISRWDVEYPKGVALLNEWSSLVCSCSLNTIYQATENVKKCKLRLQGIKRPQAVLINNQQNKLYVSRHANGINSEIGSEIGNTILVWNIHEH